MTMHASVLYVPPTYTQAAVHNDSQALGTPLSVANPGYYTAGIQPKIPAYAPELNTGLAVSTVSSLSTGNIGLPFYSFCPRFVAASSSASAKLGDSARALANSTRTAHCNDACTPRSSLAPPFSLQRDVTLPPAALPRSTVACSQDDFAPVASVTPPFCSDCHAPTAAESVPAVGTFSHDEPVRV